MFRTTWFLVLLLCSVLRSVISGNDDKPSHINSGFSKNAALGEFQSKLNRSLPSAGSRIVHMLYVTCAL